MTSSHFLLVFSPSLSLVGVNRRWDPGPLTKQVILPPPHAIRTARAFIIFTAGILQPVLFSLLVDLHRLAVMIQPLPAWKNGRATIIHTIHEGTSTWFAGKHGAFYTPHLHHQPKRSMMWSCIPALFDLLGGSTHWGKLQPTVIYYSSSIISILRIEAAWALLHVRRVYVSTDKPYVRIETTYVLIH